MFLSVVEGLRTYLVQDTTSSEVLLIQQVSLTENRLVPNTELRDLKLKNNLSRSEIYSTGSAENIQLFKKESS